MGRLSKGKEKEVVRQKWKREHQKHDKQVQETFNVDEGLNVSWTNLAESFEENEAKLQHVMGNVVIKRDRHDISCVIKGGNKKERYRPGGIPDVQNTNAANLYMDATTCGSPNENASNKLNPDRILRMKCCIIGHHSFAPRMEKQMQDIKLGPGPSASYKSKLAIEALWVFAQNLPLTQTVEALFHAFFPEEYPKYKAVYGTIYDGRADNINEAFGIWTSHSLVINANTNNHKDVENVCHRWCAIVVLGDFKGGDACLPELGVD
ncbi:hypothetical protein HOY80DRAFT_997741 [Tuber brumale]|nr:hypothetical protein HOY80DRAFT_997741 [Tuber brumale]